MTRIWFDTEFIEDGKTIDLISIGLVREDGGYLYLENADCDHSKASEWVRLDVLPRLKGGTARASRVKIARLVRQFVGPYPEFWGYCAGYDWVALCQLYGTILKRPKTWPMFCFDIKQAAHSPENFWRPKQDKAEHHALANAIWNRDTWRFLQGLVAPRVRSGVEL